MIKAACCRVLFGRARAKQTKSKEKYDVMKSFFHAIPLSFLSSILNDEMGALLLFVGEK